MERESVLREVDKLLKQKEVLKAVRLLYDANFRLGQIINVLADKMDVNVGITGEFVTWKPYLPDDQQQHLQERLLRAVEEEPERRKIIQDLIQKRSTPDLNA